MKTRALFLSLASLFVSAPAFAAADIAVNLVAPSGAVVDTMATWTVALSNVGNRNSNAMTVTVALPATNTSPGVYVLGDVGTNTGNCSLSGTSLSCPVASIRKGNSTSFTFKIALPVSSAPIVVSATASLSGDGNLSNNTSSRTAALSYIPGVAIGAATNWHCTGTGLTSFFECELFPSSLSEHDTTFLSDGTIDLGYPGYYSGTWQQSASDSLSFQYFELGTLVASFSGKGVGGGCFEGLTTFPGSSYVSPYEVCF